MAHNVMLYMTEHLIKHLKERKSIQLIIYRIKFCFKFSYEENIFFFRIKHINLFFLFAVNVMYTNLHFSVTASHKQKNLFTRKQMDKHKQTHRINHNLLVTCNQTHKTGPNNFTNTHTHTNPATHTHTVSRTQQKYTI